MGQTFGLLILCIILGGLIQYIISYKSGISLNMTDSCPIIEFTNENKDLLFLLDTGADISYISVNALPGLRYKPIQSLGNTFAGANSAEKILGWINLNFHYRDKEFNDNFAVINMEGTAALFKDNRALDGILGSQFLANYESMIDIKNQLFYPEL